jgi:predicted phage terminase large subunit-like protein
MDKLMRLHAQSDLFEAGKVFLPESAAWLEDYRTEVIGFPGSKYNDQVDSTAQALDCLKKGPSRSFVTWQKLGRQHGPLLF